MEDIWGIHEYLQDKGNVLSVGNWIALASNVEGRDKFLKIIQFTSRALKWVSSKQGDEKSALAWEGLQMSIQEGRKSVRILKGINKLDQCFTEVPQVSSSYEKALILGHHLGLAFHWHFDYLAHASRSKFVSFETTRYKRVLQAPSFAWSFGNCCQILLGLHTLRRAAEGIAKAHVELSAASSEARSELEGRLRALRIQRFKGWLLVVKGFADFFTSGSMAGVDLQKRFPDLFGWLGDPAIGLSGVVSAVCVLLNNFPSRASSVGKEPGGWQKQQNERNAAAAIFTFMQLSTMVKARASLA